MNVSLFEKSDIYYQIGFTRFEISSHGLAQISLNFLRYRQVLLCQVKRTEGERATIVGCGAANSILTYMPEFSGDDRSQDL